MAEVFHLDVEGWDLDTSLQESTSESSAPVNELLAAKRRRFSLCLSRKRATSTTTTATERFEFLDAAKSKALSKKFVPKNTEKSTQWGLSTFLTWRDRRNECFSEESEKQVPLDLLRSTDPVAICKWFTMPLNDATNTHYTLYHQYSRIICTEKYYHQYSCITQP